MTSCEVDPATSNAVTISLSASTEETVYPPYNTQPVRVKSSDIGCGTLSLYVCMYRSNSAHFSKISCLRCIYMNIMNGIHQHNVWHSINIVCMAQYIIHQHSVYGTVYHSST